MRRTRPVLRGTIKMGRMDVILPDELEQKLRLLVGRKMGARKGNLTKAIKEAIENWIKENQ
jgi:predicted DNA-binding protein